MSATKLRDAGIRAHGAPNLEKPRAFQLDPRILRSGLPVDRGLSLVPITAVSMSQLQWR